MLVTRPLASMRHARTSKSINLIKMQQVLPSGETGPTPCPHCLGLIIVGENKICRGFFHILRSSTIERRSTQA